MSSKEEYMFHSISSLKSERGLIAIDKNGVVILQTKNLRTGETVDVCLAGTLEELSGFLEAMDCLISDLKAATISEPEKEKMFVVPGKKIIH